MAEQEEQVEAVAAEDDETDSPNYKPPEPKSLNEICELDKEDDSLRRYKEQLLGASPAGLGQQDGVIIDGNNPLNVIVKKFCISLEQTPEEKKAKVRDPIDIDLSVTDEKKKREYKVVLKEGCKYRVNITFYVQREIVCGLRYEHKVYRKGFQVDKESYMVGSYPPKKDTQEYSSPIMDAPDGLLARGDYTVKSCFTDDDKNIYLSWEWMLTIKKDFD